MGRGKIEIKKIENVNSRQVTFSKRRSGLMKKANELSVLCDADVGVIVFSSTGKLYEFSSSSMDQILDRYRRVPNTLELPSIEHVAEVQNPQSEVRALKEELSKLRALCLRMQGKGLEDLNVKELQLLEYQLNDGILSVRNKKERGMFEQIEKSKSQEQKTVIENEKLRREVEELRHSSNNSPCCECNAVKRLRLSNEGCKADSAKFLSLGWPTGGCGDGENIPKTESGSHDSTSQMASG